MYDYSKLLGLILSLFNSRFEFAMALGVTPQTLNNKLHNYQPWNQYQIEECCKLLGITRKEIPTYFFSLKS